MDNETKHLFALVFLCLFILTALSVRNGVIINRHHDVGDDKAYVMESVDAKERSDGNNWEDMATIASGDCGRIQVENIEGIDGYRITECNESYYAPNGNVYLFEHPNEDRDTPEDRRKAEIAGEKKWIEFQLNDSSINDSVKYPAWTENVTCDGDFQHCVRHGSVPEPVWQDIEEGCADKPLWKCIDLTG